MSYNGSGTFLINTAGQPVVTGTVISSTTFNTLTADLGTGLSTAITKDGQTTTTSRIPFIAGISSTLTTDSTSVGTGSIISSGGVGIAKALFVGTTANIAGAVTLGGAVAITSSSANALAVGLNGATNPAFNVDASTASSATGLNVKSAAAAGGVALSVTSSGSNEALTLNAKGTGTIGIGSVSTGAVTITPATTVTGLITSTGGITGGASSHTTGAFSSTLGVTGAATLSSTLDVTGISSFAAGTAALPSITRTGDLDTGMWFPAANTLGFSTSGSERARLDSSGGLTLGFAASPYNSAQMEIYRATAGDALMISSPTGTGNQNAIAWSDSRGDVVSARIYNVDDGAYGASIVFANRTGVGTTTTEKMRLDTSGNLTITAAALLGYGTGAGGTVTQATNKGTGVTLNKPTGQVTTNNAALAGGATVSFTVNNSLCSAADLVLVVVGNGSSYTVQPVFVGAGYFNIRLTNITGGSLSEAVQINFAIIKGASA